MADFIDPSGISSAEAFGAETLVAEVYPSGIVGVEAFGTGTLEAGIYPSGNSVGTQITIKFDGAKNGNWFYGGFQEYGWVTVNGRKIPGKHFMREASDESGKSALDTAINIIKAEIETAAKRG